MRALAKTNYPAISCLIRFAVLRQMIEERLEIEDNVRRRHLLDENWRLQKELKQLKKIFKVPENFLTV